MYVDKQPVTSASGLEQGDLLPGFLLPDLASAAAVYRQPPKTTSYLPLRTGELKGELPESLRVAVPLRVVDVLVVANSCDISGGGAIAVVPVGPLKLAGDPSKPKIFEEIRRRATSSNWAKSFYLGASPVTVWRLEAKRSSPSSTRWRPTSSMRSCAIAVCSGRRG